MLATNNSTETPTPSGISRRTVVKGAAWAVPVIAVAGAVPAMAASQCIAFSFGAGSCKDPGTPFGYTLVLCIIDTCQETGVFPLTVTQIDTGNNRYLTYEQWGDQPPTPVSDIVEATFQTSGECKTINGYSHGSSNNLTINYTQYDGTDGSFTIAAPPSCVDVTTTTTTTAPGVTTATTTAEVTTTTTTAPVTTTTTTAEVTTMTTTVL